MKIFGRNLELTRKTISRILKLILVILSIGGWINKYEISLAYRMITQNEQPRTEKGREVGETLLSAKEDNKKPCEAGKMRNPKTGRCIAIKKLSTGEESKKPQQCKDNERFDEKKKSCVLKNLNDGADFPLIPETSIPREQHFIAAYAIFLIGMGVFLYLIWQYRQEIYNKLFSRTKPKK